jgi:transcriptional regulator with XRE-family HTH domain
MSQLDLSAASGVTSRHVSFVETGRSAPTREMLDTLADALEMPLRDRNDLYLAAGYAPPYRELGLDAAELADAMFAIDRILDTAEPYPAVVMDRHWNLLRTNGGAIDLFGRMIGAERLGGPANVLDMVFDPDGLRPFVVDWDHVAPGLLTRAHREAVGGVPDPALIDRLRRLGAELPPDRAIDAGVPTGPLIDVAFDIDGTVLRFFSTVTTLGTPRDVTLQEIRIEQFHPADDTTRDAYRR